MDHSAEGMTWYVTRLNLMTLSGSVWVWVLVRGVVITVFTVGAMYCLGKVLVGVASGEFFLKNSAILLRVGALLIFLTCLIPLFFDGFINAEIIYQLDSSVYVLWVKRFDGVEPLLLGISLLVATMAEAFARGWSLKQDTEGLI
ncbi:MAG: hypothetical protein CSA83_01230 [Actinomycetales bacterium]|nr:MAG: hypothetical protein CSA83_01230 [Actinomycetales bacterium]